MNFLRREERGQTVVEFGIICSILLILTVGLVDVGRAFFQYNALSAGARYGARWASVVGGTCQRQIGSRLSTSDWCDQIGQVGSDFWLTAGNKPLQPTSSSCSGDSTGRTGCCPNDLSGPSSDYYTASSYLQNWQTTIVGAIAHRFDTNSSSYNTVDGALTPGFDLSKLYVCIQLPYNSTTGTWDTAAGSAVDVHVYYPFSPAGPLVISSQLTLTGAGQYVIE